MGRSEVEAAVESLLGQRGRFSSRELGRETGLTRQALHRHLSDWVEEGRLVREGRARATRYRRGQSGLRGTGGSGAGLGRSYLAQELTPQGVWRDLAAWLAVHAPARSATAERVLQTVVCELVGNAVAHSGSRLVTLRAHATPERVALAVKDEGPGVLEQLRARLGLAGHREALAVLRAEGGAPAAPGTGRGLRLVSALVGLFELDANGLEWSVDNELHQRAVTRVTPGVGTEVRVGIALGASAARADRD